MTKQQVRFSDAVPCACCGGATAHPAGGQARRHRRRRGSPAGWSVCDLGGWGHRHCRRGGVWVYTRSAGAWSQQGSKLVGTGAVGDACQGVSVAISADGNTAIVGGLCDDSHAGRRVGVHPERRGVVAARRQAGRNRGSRSCRSGHLGGDLGGWQHGDRRRTNDDSRAGAAWVFTRSSGAWSQQGSKLIAWGSRSCQSGHLGGDLGGWQHGDRRRTPRQDGQPPFCRRRVDLHAERRCVDAAREQASRDRRCR